MAQWPGTALICLQAPMETCAKRAMRTALWGMAVKDEEGKRWWTKEPGETEAPFAHRIRGRMAL